MTKKEPFNEQLRRAIRDSELSRYQIWQRTGILQSTLSRFMNEGCGLSMESVDKLVECLDLRLVPAEATARNRKQSRRG